MPGASYRFGPFLADRPGYRVLRGGLAVDLTPKLLDLLLHLLDRAGSLVTKEELLDALWPGANVTENALAQAVSELRQALGDDPATPQFIKTIARRGYRFIGAVDAIDAQPAADGGKDRREVDANTIAVMDFLNMSGDADCAWLSAGIAETVTGDLRALGHFRVVDRWRVMESLRRTSGTLQEVAADLRVRLAVVGSFQRSGDQIRIMARVIDVVSGEALADAKVDGPLEHVFDQQDQIVARLSTEMGLPGAGGPHRPARETPSLEAYRAFIQGWLRVESLDTGELQPAIDEFERAVALDRRYALAYTGLASAEFALYETTRSENEPAQPLLDRAIEHARQAIELETELAEAHATLALLLVSAWKTQEAVTAARYAVALEPSNWRHLFRLGHATWGEARLHAAAATVELYPDFAFAHFQMAMVHVARGHLAQAETVLRQGAAVQDRQSGRRQRFPALGLHWLLGLTRLAQGDAADALTEFDHEVLLADARRLYGREYTMNALHGRALALLTDDRPGEAVECLRRALDLYPGHAQSRLALAEALRALGSEADAASELSQVDDAIAALAAARPIEASIVRALALVARGRADEAVVTLESLLAEAPPGFAAWTLPVDPLLRQLQGHQGFTGVLRHLAERAR